MKLAVFTIPTAVVLALANVVSADEGQAADSGKIVLTNEQMDSVTAGTHQGFPEWFELTQEFNGLTITFSSFTTSSTFTSCRNGDCTTFGFGFIGGS